MEEIIKQEKSDEELNEHANSIIDSLSKLNIAEKYKVISSLYNSLTDAIKQEGIIIEEI